MWVQIGGDCMALPLHGCLVAGVNKIVVLLCCQESRCPQLTTCYKAGTLLCLNLDRRHNPVENEFNNLLGRHTPSKSGAEKCLLCRQNIEHVSVQIPEPGSVLCIRHIHLTHKALKSWLQLLLKCVKISCLQQELYTQKQGCDFPWKHSKCVCCWQWKGFSVSFPCGRGGVWTTGRGNGARRKT